MKRILIGVLLVLYFTIAPQSVRSQQTEGKATAAVSGEKMLSHPVALPKPIYPLAARKAHASGRVVVEVVIDEQGRIIAARAVKGHRLLRAASIAAAKRSRFSSASIKLTGTIVYTFVAM